MALLRGDLEGFLVEKGEIAGDVAEYLDGQFLEPARVCWGVGLSGGFHGGWGGEMWISMPRATLVGAALWKSDRWERS